jgi:small subunit ribosomal protein S9
MVDKDSTDAPDAPRGDVPAESEPEAAAPGAPEAPAREEPEAESTAPEEPGHAVPTEEAREIAGAAEDVPLEALQEAEEHAGETAAEGAEGAADADVVEPAEDAASEQAEDAAGEPAEEAASERPEQAGEPAAEAREAPAGRAGEEAAQGAKPSVPGAHLEVDIVPEGEDPLGREEGYEDPYAVAEDEEVAQAEPGAEVEEREEALAEPIATAAIDLAAGARYRATGKRKTAIARVTLRPGSGSYLVNGRTLEEHFPRSTLQRNIRQPLETVGYQERMDVIARLHGGGISAQAGALRHGVSRALLEADPNLRGELKRRGFLTRDSRAKERKKAGLKKARKRPQFSKR